MNLVIILVSTFLLLTLIAQALQKTSFFREKELMKCKHTDTLIEVASKESWVIQQWASTCEKLRTSELFSPQS